jgi:hypothetical protein
MKAGLYDRRVMRKIDLAKYGLAALVACAGCPVHAAPSLDGVYKYLQYNQESGDLLGMEVDVRTGPNPTIVVTVCEGGCWGGERRPMTITGQTIAFTVCENATDQDGHPVPCKSQPYVGHFQADGTLVLMMPNDRATRTVLRRVVHPKRDEVQSLAHIDG